MSEQDQAPSSVAGGVPAVLVTLAHARRETGLVRGLRVLGRANQRHGFDCPGCAWPDPDHRSLAEFCENGAKAIVDEATTKRVDAAFFLEHSVAFLREQSDQWLNAQGRIARPFVLDEGSEHFRPCTYDEAFEWIAAELTGLSDPHRAAFYTSGRASNEAAFLYQLLARRFGTNNLPDCSNLCHESSGVALTESIGIGKGTVRLTDFRQADLILVVGQNPGTNHPRMLTTLQEARASGTTVVSINPLIEAGLRRFAHPQSPVDLLEGGTPIADHFVRVAIGGDQALFRGLSKWLLEEPAVEGGRSGVDPDFIATCTEGYDSYRRVVNATSWGQIEADSGLSKATIGELAEMVRASRSVICTWAMGLTQHAHAVATIQELTSFLLLGGHMGREGAGVCPVRGHSNVQGDRSVGIATRLSEERHALLERKYSFESPRAPGLDTVGTIGAMLDGRVTHFVSLGGNFLSASPDTEMTTRALERCELTVQIATKLNRSHLYTGKKAILLPCLGRTEDDRPGGLPSFVTVENSMGVVHRSQGRLDGPQGVLGEPTIVARLGASLEAALGASDAEVPWRSYAGDYDLIRDAIAEVVPGFENYNRRVREPSGFELPNGPRERRFTTPTGKARFLAHPLERLRPGPGELILTTVRSHDQFNTTIYTDTDRYRGVHGERRVILMNRDDLVARGLRSGDRVRIESRFRLAESEPEECRRVEGFRALAYDVPRTMAVAYFPEANPLIALQSIADRSRTPTSKSIRIVVTRMEPLGECTDAHAAK